MTDTSVDNVKILMGKFTRDFTDDEITSIIAIAKTIVSNQAPDVSGDNQELLQRWMSAHLLIRRKGIEYTGRGVSNMTVGQVTLNRSSPEELMRSNQLYTEYTELLKSLTSTIAHGKTQYKTTPSYTDYSYNSARDLL